MNVELKIVLILESLVSHALKIALKILTGRLESTAESYLWKDQVGFSLEMSWHNPGTVSIS